jgi:phenylacetate-CoA ligase
MIWDRLYWSGYLAWMLLGEKRIPFLPLQKIKQLQNDRLRKTVARAYHTVPFYRKEMNRLGLRVSDFRNVDDLEKLPEILRIQLQKSPSDFLSTSQSEDQYLKLRSGGSTGNPCTIYHDASSIFQNAAQGERERSILAGAIGKSWYRETVIASPVSSAREVQDFLRERSLVPRRRGIQRQYLTLADSPETNLKAINEFEPDLIRSYGSYLNALFPFIHETGANFHKPRVIHYSSDAISASVRHLIQETFGIPVFSAYQANEAFLIGFECEEHTGLHLNVDLYPVRITDDSGKTLPVGESGNLIISNLVNHATVLLNYRLGDISRILKEPCPCGRTLPLLAFPQGRTDDWIQMDSGRMLHPQAVRTIFTNEYEVWQYQVQQLESDAFRVLLVTAPACDRTELSSRIRKSFFRTFGDQTKTEVHFVDSLPRTPGGKIRPIMSLKKSRNIE